MPSQDVLKQYEDVKLSLENALKESDKIEISGDEENSELTHIRKTLSALNDDFREEIEKLEKSSEWDRFCMAFFGETNAGKSTIIETLRIIYDEEKRRENIEKQERQLQEELLVERTDYSNLVDSLGKLNDLLIEDKNAKIKKIAISIGFILIGIVVGFLMAGLVF